MECWEKFLTPKVEVDEEYRETRLTFQCDIRRKMIKIYYGEEDRIMPQCFSNVAMAVFPLCLSCAQRQSNGHSDSNRSEDIGF